MLLGEYLNIVNDGVRDDAAAKPEGKKSRWFARIADLNKRQRAFDSLPELSSWNIQRLVSSGVRIACYLGQTKKIINSEVSFRLNSRRFSAFESEFDRSSESKKK
ncbi:MAG: putative ester cyclase [Candidatus Azotimanducaceae bacterium]|jgi:predicted ester cyclase